MKVNEIRNRYLKYFKNLNHTEIKPSSLVLPHDPTTLFTSSGMQQLVPFLLGKKHPKGNRLVNSQPCLRAHGVSDDIEEVGDQRHLTYFEMLGNWSLGDYFKKDQLAWFYEFLTKHLGLTKERLFVSVFAGTKEIPKDIESLNIWKALGIPNERIFYYGVKKNWWSRFGAPQEMPPNEIGGPDSEVFFDFKIPHDKSFGKNCHPNCDCGRFLEIGNSVFIQYIKTETGELKELEQKNVDFGAGLERLAAASLDSPDLYRIDIFTPVIKKLEKETKKNYEDAIAGKSFRVISDHVRSALMLISQGIEPDNKMQGYVLRRIIRRSIFHLHLLGVDTNQLALVNIAESFIDQYPEFKANWHLIDKTLSSEGQKFGKALARGLSKLQSYIARNSNIEGKFLFDLYQTEGFPIDLTLEVLKENGIKFAESQRKKFREEFEGHKKISRGGL